MKSPLVSVLVPCHNAAPWLAQALGSALDQTWSHLEVIVVDDGSTDTSPAVARRFASYRCQVVRQERRGASAARNRALSLAQGDVIQYLDADDFLAPDKVERQIASLAQERWLSWGSVVHLLDGTGHGRRKREEARFPMPDRVDPVQFLSDLWSGLGASGMVALHQWLTPRRLIEEAGPWDERLTVDDDGEFFARVILAAERLIPIPESTCFYRRFRAGRNLSASVFHSSRHRQSAMQAAQMKAGYLLARSSGNEARLAASRLVTREIVAAYPDDADLVAGGLNFLEKRGVPFCEKIEGSPWFCRAHAWLGWKAARRLQKYARALRYAGPFRDSSLWSNSKKTTWEALEVSAFRSSWWWWDRHLDR